MQVATAPQVTNAPPLRMPEAKEAGPDRDGDKDNKAVTAPPPPSSLPKNVGTKVDVAA